MSNVTTDSTDQPRTTTVFVVDDHSGYCAVAASVIRATPGFTYVGSAATTNEALANLDRLAGAPDLILMDINLKTECGIDVTQTVKARYPETKVVLISTLRADELPRGSTTCGAAGFLPKLQLSSSALEDLWAGAYDWEQ